MGATGSIGRQALDVIERSPWLEVAGMAARQDHTTLLAAAARTGCRDIAVLDEDARASAMRVADGVVIHGDAGAILDATQPDIVLNAAVGSAGLNWTLQTASRGIDLALANKESLVAGGPVVARLLRAAGGCVLPVDSEHTALHQLLTTQGERVRKLTFTGSGGPFRGRRWADLSHASVAEALRHPTWSMGTKLTVDSATLVNKGLELIEARYLFDWDPDNIEITVQPGSCLHAAVTLSDGTLVGALSHPDMRHSISYALHYPERPDIGIGVTTVAGLGALANEPLPNDFPAVELARAALTLEARGGTAVFNAADEVAVGAFIRGVVGFTDIIRIIEEAMNAAPTSPVSTVEDIQAVDVWARTRATELVNSLLQRVVVANVKKPAPAEPAAPSPTISRSGAKTRRPVV